MTEKTGTKEINGNLSLNYRCRIQSRVHDFKLCRQTILKLLLIGVMLYADSGYQGIAKVHANSVIPIKKKKHKGLSEEEKCFNHELSSKRVAVEHANMRYYKHRKSNLSYATSLFIKNFKKR